MSKPIVVMFSGKASSGKTASADILKSLLEQRGKKSLNVSMGDRLKHIATQYLGWNGEKDEKGRQLLQSLGTEKFRMRNPNFWTDSVLDMIEVFEDDFDYILIDDIRYQNEITAFEERAYRAITIRVVRPCFDNGLTKEQKLHSSEVALDEFCFDVKISATDLLGLKEEIENKVLRPVLWMDSSL